MKINTAIKTQKTINLTGLVDKQMRSKEESNTTKPIKWQKLLYIFQ
jgi:hypothetical protein